MHDWLAQQQTEFYCGKIRVQNLVELLKYVVGTSVKVNCTVLCTFLLKITFHTFPFLKLIAHCLFYSNQLVKIPNFNTLCLHSASCRNLKLKHGDTSFETKYTFR